jgi:hypothetical protein
MYEFDLQTTRDKTYLRPIGTMATTQDAKTKKQEIILQTVDGKKWKKLPWSDAELLRVLRQQRENHNFRGRFEHLFRTPLNLTTDLPLPQYETDFGYDHYGFE